VAARMIDCIEARGKVGKVTASNISFYTRQHMKSGRNASGLSTFDALGTQSHLNGHSELHSLSEIVAEAE
jgi:hypothetical protein